MIKLLTSKAAPVFALAALVFSFLQLYTKLYYYSAPGTGLFYLDLFISIIAGAGLATVNAIILIHSKNRNTPLLFGFLDFFGAVLFMNSNETFLETFNITRLGIAFFIPVLKACSIYFLAEIFLRYHKETEQTENKSTSLSKDLETKTFALSELQKQYDLITEQLKSKDEQIALLEITKKEGNEQTQNLLNDLQTKYSNLQASYDNLQANSSKKDFELLQSTEQLSKIKEAISKTFTPLSLNRAKAAAGEDKRPAYDTLLSVLN